MGLPIRFHLFKRLIHCILFYFQSVDPSVIIAVCVRSIPISLIYSKYYVNKTYLILDSSVFRFLKPRAKNDGVIGMAQSSQQRVRGVGWIFAECEFGHQHAQQMCVRCLETVGGQ